MNWSCSLRVLLATGLALLGPSGALAQESPRAAGAPVDPPGAFTRVEARRFAGVFALGGLAYLADDVVRDAVRGRSSAQGGVIEGLSQFGYYYGEPGVAILSVAMWGAGLLADRPTLAVSGFRAVEAVAVSGLVTVVTKELTGRARPDVAPNRKDDWQLSRTLGAAGNDYKAMPSGHATVAFAFATAVTAAVADRAPEYTRRVAVTTFGLAALTSWQRMHDDRHWLSDVTVGAGIGTVTALAITRWHATRPTNPIDQIFLSPIIAPARGGGMQLGVSLRAR